MEFKEAMKAYQDQFFLKQAAYENRKEAEEEEEGQEKNLVETALDVERSLTLDGFKDILKGPEEDARELLNKFYDVGRKAWEAHFDFTFDSRDQHTLGAPDACSHLLQCTEPGHHEDGKLCVRIVGYSRRLGHKILNRIAGAETLDIRPFLTLGEAKATPEMKAFAEGVMRRRALATLAGGIPVDRITFGRDSVDIDWSDEDSDALYDKLVAEGLIISPDGQPK